MTPIYKNAKIILPNFLKMFAYPPTIVIRHRRENLKKCSLAGLESRQDFLFLSYPLEKKWEFPNYFFLTMDENAPSISLEDGHKGILMLDATWRLALKMESNILELALLEKRSLPQGFKTGYPRRQLDCPDPTRGLSSLEALAIAYRILGRDTELLLQNYYWKEIFFSQNADIWMNLQS